LLVNIILQTWIKKNVLRMSDEEIEEMEKEMEEDGSAQTYMMQNQQSGEQPVDQTQPTEEVQESPTPELDSQVQKYSDINR
jgi:hypothetical protein